MPRQPAITAAAPAPLITFEGLDRQNWGAGSPPDTNGDVGPEYYIQTVNTSVGVYRKSDGFREAAFTFDTLMSQGNFGNMCDTDNFGDPVVLYDTFEDRWILSDFAFQLDAQGNVSPAVAYQCFAVSMNGNPVSGGWNFYSIELTDGLNDYPKFGIWPDGLYMTANMFDFAASGSFQQVRVWAFNKAQMYAGSPTVKVVSFDVGDTEFTVIPSNARLQAGAPPAGRPNYFVSTSNFLNAVGVYKFHVDWNSISLSSFTGPDVPLAATSWPNADITSVPQQGTTMTLDTLSIRAMVQNQYTNIAGAESLWVPHTVRRQTTTELTGFAAPRWYQVNVTGGTVAANLPQAKTWDPDGANVMHRFMPSLAIDRAGNMALGYSTSSSTSFPSIKYAGRLATDPINTFSQTEQILFTGTASQTGVARWGDYSSMTLDPDGCRFWYTSEYANPVSQDFDKRWKTRIGSFKYAECTTVGAGGTVSGTVTATTGGAPISGASVVFGARSTTTNGSGSYSFLNIPAGTYPSISASSPGYTTASASNIVVTDGGTTTQNFSLDTAPASACLTDTTQANFQTGVPTNVDLTASPGDVKLASPDVVDRQTTNFTTSGVGFSNTTFAGQTFTPGVSGPLKRIDVNIFCSSCSGANPNLILEARTTTSGNIVMTAGALLASSTIAGTSSGSGGYMTFNFATPPTLTAGTQYGFVVKLASARIGTQAVLVSDGDGLTGGRRQTCSSSSCSNSSGQPNDIVFISYMNTGFAASGNFVSSVKDANPVAGRTPIWTNLSWNASVPANTTLQFQVAASSSVNGPFNFVGPNGTAGTFFTTSPASLSQFYGFQYLQYKAYLTTSSSAVTPTVNDVTVCYTNVDCSGPGPAITPTPAQVCTGSTGNTASGPAGMTSYSWSITNGSITGGATTQTVTYTAGTSGNVGLTLNVVQASGCQKSSSLNVPIVTVPTPTITPGGPTTFCAGGSVLLTSSSASGNQWFLNGNPIGGETNQTYSATASGNYTVVVTTSGCASAPSAATTVTVNPIPPTPTITPGGSTTFCTGGSVLLTSSSASGNQWYLNGNPIGGQTNQTYSATASGNYTVVVTTNGCASATSSPTTVTVNPVPATPTITPGGPTTFCTGGSVLLTSSSASGNQWFLNGNPIGGETNQTYSATASGNYTVVVTTSGCASTPSAATTVTVNPIPPTPTITPGGSTTFCTGGSVLLTSSSASGNQWFLNGNPIGGQINQTYNATASGNYTVVVTTNGCASAASAPTTVTVNPIPATPTITPGGSTTFCTGGSVLLTSSSASGNQWFLNGNPIGGETNQTYNATASGNYTVVVTENGCASAPSAPTTVTVNPTPATPTITPGGSTTFCTGGSVLLTSSSASGNQWFLNGNPIGGETNQTYNATASGNYTVVVTTNGCASTPSSATTVTVNPIPPTPTITPGGSTTFCTGGSVLLTSSGASGNQWFLNGNPIGGETNQTYNATASGNYTVVVTENGCASAPSAATTVTVNPTPATPTINAGGPTTFCTGGSVLLTSSSASGNQWFLNGNPIGGETNQTYSASASGNYTVVVTENGCASAPSAPTTVTVNPIPATPTITPGGATTFCTGGSVLLTSSSATGNQWFLNGNPIGGETNQTYSATASGNYTVVVTTNGCASAASSPTTVTVNPVPATPTITPGGSTTFCTGGSVLLTSSSASGNQWFLNGNPIGGETNQTYSATASGNYTVAVTENGCASAASAPTTVTVNPTPATPTITPGGSTTFCTGGSALLTSSSASGNQWFLNGNPIGGATNQTYGATASGNYTVVVTENGCANAPSAPTTVTVNPTPPTPTITPGGSTTFCAGGSVLLTSSSASGNQWFLNGNPISGETNQTYNATASANYTVVVTMNGCASAQSAPTTVTVNPIPAAPTITPGGSATFCTDGGVTLTSSSATGNQWYRNGVLLGTETGQTTIATIAGTYTVTVTSGGCTSAPSAPTTVTANPKPDATITVDSPMYSGASANAVVSASCTGATFAWTITGGTITSGNGTRGVTFTSGAAGTLTLGVTMTNEFGCTDSKSANVTVQLPSFGAPPFLKATATSTTSTALLWAAVASADHYEVYRATDGVNFTLRGTNTSPTFSESGLTPSTTYFYRVRAIKADTTASGFSAIDPATTVVFTEDPLASVCLPIIKAVHVTELRSAINIVRASVGLPAFTFTDPSITAGSTIIKAVHVTELRTALGAALSVISVTPAYTDPTITVGTTVVKRAHIQELRELTR